MKKTKIEVGDRIIFKACTRYSFEKATRVVRGVNPAGHVLVKYAGYTDFIVHSGEIIKVIK